MDDTDLDLDKPVDYEYSLLGQNTSTYPSSTDLERSVTPASYDKTAAPPPPRFSKAWWFKVVNHLFVNLAIIGLIVVDGILLIIRALIDDEDTQHVLEVISYLILSAFLLELGLRIYALGPRFFNDPWNVADGFIIIFAFVISIVVDANGFSHLLLLGRLLRALLVLSRLRSKKNAVSQAARNHISENKQRFQFDGFDLDLVYITNRIIAMSVPAIKGEQLYRNPIDEVVRFFDTYHAKHYMICNTTVEKRNYDPKKFHRVEYFPMADHNVPPLRMMVVFSRVVEQWMNQHEDNIIAVHCKGGKGRTGTMVCSYLLHSGFVSTAEQAMSHFERMRTDFTKGQKLQGVQTPSQRRYIRYYERMLKAPERYRMLDTDRPVLFNALVIRDVPSLNLGGAWRLVVESYRFDPEVVVPPHTDMTFEDAKEEREGVAQLTINMNDTELVGDLKLIVKCGKDTFCSLWVHTSFLPDGSLEVPKLQVDKLHKDKKHKRAPEGLTVELRYRSK